MKRLFRVASCACLLGWLAAGCDDDGKGQATGGDAAVASDARGVGKDAPIGTGGGGGVGTDARTASGDGPTSSGGTGGVPPVTGCDVANPQCSDGIDNDGDGLVDSADPECVGPCDNDERSFATGIPGDNKDACKQDCFFDGNSGQGDDGCEWNLKCDPKSPGAGSGCPYDDKAKCKAEQSEQCIKTCRSRTPNGCDCFGCCTVAVGAMTKSVLLLSSCTAANFGDPTKCPECTPNPSCINTCEKCEVCIGKPAPDPSCPTARPPGSDAGAGTGGSSGSDAGSITPAPQCDPGLVSCGPGGQVPVTGCATGTFCITGCCVGSVE